MITKMTARAAREHSEEVKSCSNFILELLSQCGESDVALAARRELAYRQGLQHKTSCGEGMYEVVFGNGTPVVVSATVEAESADDAAVVVGSELQRHMQGSGLIEIRPVDDRVESIGIRIAPEHARVRFAAYGEHAVAA